MCQIGFSQWRTIFKSAELVHSQLYYDLKNG